MVTRQKILLFSFSLFLILFIPSIFASTNIDNVGVFYQDQPIEYIKPKFGQIVDFNFHIQTQNEVDSIIANLSDLTLLPQVKEEYESLQFVPSYCVKDYDVSKDANNKSIFTFKGYNCSYPFLKLHMNKESANVTIDVQFKDSAIEPIKVTEKVGFTLDETQPQVKELRTGNCYDGKCYLASVGDGVVFNKIEMEFNDSVGSFNQRRIYFKIGNENTQTFDNCTSSYCVKENYISNCIGGQAIPLSLVSSRSIPSADDAGNEFSNDGRTTIICDEFAPTFTVADINHTYSGTKPYPTPLKQGDVIKFQAKIKDDASGVIAYGNFEEINNDNSTIEASECIVTTEGSICTWLVTATNHGDFYVYFNATDRVGHVMKQPIAYRLHIDEYKYGENVTTPKFFADVETESVAQAGYNRVALGLMLENNLDAPLYQTFKLQKVRSEKVEVVYYQPILSNLCYIDLLNGTKVNAGGFLEFEYADPFLPLDKTNRVNVKFALPDVNAYPDRFEIVCNASVFVRVNEREYYEDPSQFKLTIPMKLRNSALGNNQPGEELAEKIIQKEKEMHELWDWFDTLEMFISGMGSVCSSYGTVADVNTQTAKFNLQTLALGDKNPVKISANKMHALSEIMLDNPLGKMGANMCSFLNCNTQKIYKENSLDSAEKTPENLWITGGSLKLEGLFGNSESSTPFAKTMHDKLLDGVDRPDVRESLISSAFTGCLPGVVYHLNKYRQADCHQLLCYKQNARYGLSLDVCDEAKSYYICTAMVSEVFEVPGIRGVMNLADNANSLIQGLIPHSLDIILKSSFCKDHRASDLTSSESNADLAVVWGCQLPEAIGRQIDKAQRNTKTSQSFMYTVQDDICSLALCNEDDIRKCADNTPSWLGGMQKMNFFDVGTLDFNVETSQVNAGYISELFTKAKQFNEEGRKAREELITRGADPNILNIDPINPKKDEPLIDQVPLEKLNSLKKYCDSQIQSLSKMSQKDVVTFNEDKTVTYEFTIPKLYEDKQKVIDNIETNVDHKLASDIYGGVVADIQTAEEYTEMRKIYVAHYNYVKQQNDIDDSGNVPENTGTNFFTYKLDITPEEKTKLENYLTENIEDFDSADLDKMNEEDSPLPTYDYFSDRERNNDMSKLMRADYAYQGADPNYRSYKAGLKEIEKAEREQEQIILKEMSVVLDKQTELNIKYPDKKPDQYSEEDKKTHDKIQKQIEGLGLSDLNEELKKVNNLNNKFIEAQQKLDSSTLDKTHEGYKELIKARDAAKNKFFKQELIVAKRLNQKASSDAVKDYFEKQMIKQRRIEQKKAYLESINYMTDQVLSFMYSQGWLNWAKLSEFSHYTALGELSSWSDTYLNSERYKESMCDGLLNTNLDSGTMEGSAIQCEDGSCRAVLTMASEKLKVNDTHYAYTLTYYLGNVKKPANYNEDYIKYNVILRSPGVEKKWFNTSWLRLDFGDNKNEDYGASRLLKDDYKEICIIFSRPFPPYNMVADATSKDTYCRTIKDSTKGTFDYDTGSVYVKPVTTTSTSGNKYALSDD